MPDSQEWPPWSDSPNAPNISYRTYFDEKTNFNGSLLSSILYGTPDSLLPIPPSVRAHTMFPGIVIVVFFQCMAALFNPVYRRGEPIKWGLVSYTVVMFSLATVQTVLNLHIFSISYIDDRKFPGFDGVPPGPLAYQLLAYTRPVGLAAFVMYPLSNWLADGLLVSFPLDVAFPHPDDSHRLPPPIALSLLHSLLYEPLGHRLPLHHTPRLNWYEFDFLTKRPGHSGLIFTM